MTPTRELAHPKLAGFDVQAYLATVTRAARQRSCLLCGRRHEPRIHAWYERLVRCADGRNHQLVIVSLICEQAKRQGKQYTKRMLPSFVIPECNIRLDLAVNLLQLVERHPGSGMKLAYKHGAGVIGSVSERTIARHLGWVRRLIAASVLEASELLAELAPFAALPEVRAGGGGLAELQRYLMALAIARGRAVGRSAGGAVLGVIGCLHLRYVVVRARNPVAFPLNQVLRHGFWFDTS